MRRRGSQRVASARGVKRNEGRVNDKTVEASELQGRWLLLQLQRQGWWDHGCER